MAESSNDLKGEICETIEGDFGGHFSQVQKEIVLDIFSRLSFKDLSRCRRVKKSWYRSIPSPYFSKLHHEKSASRGTYFVSYILQEFNASDSVPCNLNLLEVSYSTECQTYVLDLTPLRTKFQDMNLTYEFVGSCNGILCLSEMFMYDPIYICNPLIGEYITLPSWNIITDGCIISGFGCDQKTGDYKVIRMAYNKVVLGIGEIRHDLLAEVYTLGSKIWRKIEVVPFEPGFKPGVFLNGVIHWMDMTCNNIMCFDIHSENFSLLKLPPGYNNGEISSDYVSFLEVRVLKGHLCVFDKNNHDFNIWMMERYGDEKSWMRKDTREGFNLELNRICAIMQRFRHIHGLYPYMVSFVTHINPEEEASGGDKD